SRDFSARPVHGGSPAYPSEYEEQGRSGVVGVGCRIETSGVPTGCHVTHVAGGEAFGNAVLDWLRSGRVRFAPILRNGQPVAETQSWNVTFSP
ncbi:MAG TPA: TonB family protein, partial [Acetobacteraceae bacterium]|nr:TonB family protein [Acetobacteraceae bacterium]